MVEIEFCSEKFNREEKDIIRDLLLSKLIELGEVLQISTLERVIITDSFTNDVVRIQEEYRMKEKGHTAGAWAKVLNTELGESLRQTIVINETTNMIEDLFNPDLGLFSFHIICHEICHVHDNYYQHTMFTPETRKRLNILEAELVRNAVSIWSEYIAERLSSYSLTPEAYLTLQEIYLSDLNQTIVSCKKRLEEAISHYPSDINIVDLCNLMMEETLKLFKSAAINQGYIDGIAQNTENYVNEKIMNTYFYDTWLRQWEVLRNLYNNYPIWNDVYRLLDLGEIINICWNEFGFYPTYKSEKDQIYLNIRKNH